MRLLKGEPIGLDMWVLTQLDKEARGIIINTAFDIKSYILFSTNALPDAFRNPLRIY